MNSVGVHDARTHFSKLLRRVEMGEKIAITRRGATVAMLVPLKAPREMSPGEAVKELMELRKNFTQNSVPIRSLIEKGRRF